MTDTLVTAKNLNISLTNSDKALVKGIDFSIGRERVALVGESGSGKSLTARSLMGLLPDALTVDAQELKILNRDVQNFRVRQWNQLRGKDVTMVLQDPKYALNPTHTIGRQVEEPLILHQKLSRRQRQQQVENMLDAVGLKNPKQLKKMYPHQLSGGMGQRVMLAIALINDPQLLIADEPTSALDHAVRDQVLELIYQLVEQRNMGLLLISHDLEQVADYSERVLVMYQGKIVDRLPAQELPNAQHPYTKTLWSCRPNRDKRGQSLPVLDRAKLEEFDESA
ncbi:ABC transporter ATP-binding protein [Celerinatantimonas diazotrophica]|uniref:ABC-type dipeptide transporter n=1 Tax=Celerinatantimonas diazotrophica TaxID=412034 RepID=A0A4R1K2J9_9GAMM|nr:ABC transporter ATP-binding protein [Celerinatantimonas diazotrophica]TCK57923.1 peptide/nickel transport system ATP-binding protein [Celerinatantimonas diazotrophica]CAG9298009.1 Dipeptide transport ATP-binding protein DppD [Celerinatantimonas diazotrophica]